MIMPESIFSNAVYLQLVIGHLAELNHPIFLLFEN